MEYGVPFQKFLELIAIDQNVATLQKTITTLEKEVSVLQKQEQDARVALATVEQTMVDAKKVVEGYEREMKSHDDKVRDQRDRLERASNQKEYHSLKAEIELTKKKQHDLEDTLLKAWHALEQRTKEYQEKQLKTDVIIIEAQGALAAVQEKINQFKQEVEGLIINRVAKEQEVPSEWLDKYVLMRARVADPIVPVIQNSCSACFYKVLEQDMVLLRRKKLVQCKDCYRLLYLESQT